MYSSLKKAIDLWTSQIKMQGFQDLADLEWP